MDALYSFYNILKRRFWSGVFLESRYWRKKKEFLSRFIWKKRLTDPSLPKHDAYCRKCDSKERTREKFNKIATESNPCWKYESPRHLTFTPRDWHSSFGNCPCHEWIFGFLKNRGTEGEHAVWSTVYARVKSMERSYRVILISFVGFFSLIIFIVLFFYCIFCWFNCSTRLLDKKNNTETDQTQMTQVTDQEMIAQQAEFLKALLGTNMQQGQSWLDVSYNCHPVLVVRRKWTLHRKHWVLLISCELVKRKKTKTLPCKYKVAELWLKVLMF